jgi:hypothetical protein
MKLAAALAVAMTLLLPGAGAASGQRVLGIDSTVLGMRLAWYDPATLTKLPGRTVSLANHAGNWSFSPDRTRLAVASGGATDLRFIDVKRMRVLGTVRLGTKFHPVGMTWLRANRLLAVVGNVVVVVDPTHLRVVRKARVPGIVRDALPTPDGLAVLLGQDVNGFAPAKVAAVDGEGRVRAVTIDRITVGFQRNGDAYEVRQAGLAVDPAARRAFVVGGDGMIAEVDLRSPAVSYHGSTRSLAKELPGPQWTARWLGNGLLAVSGSDGLQRKGLRIVDTRDWSTRVVDGETVALALGDGVLVGSSSFCCPLEFSVFGSDGTPRYRFELESGQGLQVASRYGYVCRGVALVRVVELATGATLRQVQTAPAPACAALLYGRNSAQ